MDMVSSTQNENLENRFARIGTLGFCTMAQSRGPAHTPCLSYAINATTPAACDLRTFSWELNPTTCATCQLRVVGRSDVQRKRRVPKVIHTMRKTRFILAGAGSAVFAAQQSANVIDSNATLKLKEKPLSAAARAQRKNNFETPTAEELREMQTLEAHREGRIAQRHQREQQRAQLELQNANILTQIIIQVPAVIDSNKALIESARDYMEIYSAKVLAEIKKDPEEKEADPDPPADLGGGG